MSGGALTLAGVCGWPIHHSLSPVLHNFWLRHAGLKGAYVHFAVRPDEAHRAFSSLKHTSISGVNVTMPLKELAYKAADIITPDAEKLGVSNCLYVRDGKVYAHNTDMEGFAAPLLSKFGADNIMNVPALVIGTGGAAQAVIGALLSLNCPEIRLCGRNDRRAEELAQSVNVPSLYAVPWSSRHNSLRSAGLVLNAGAGGMTGKAALDLDLMGAVPGTFIYDLVYTPLKTDLLLQAEKQGLPHTGGLDMLIAQARPSFRLFFGQEAPLDPDPMPMMIRALGEQS